MPILILACTRNCTNIVSTMSRVKFLRIVICFQTLLAPLPLFWDISSIGSEIVNPLYKISVFSSYQHLFHHAQQFAVIISTYSMKFWNVHTWYLTYDYTQHLALVPQCLRLDFHHFLLTRRKNFIVTSIHIGLHNAVMMNIT